MFAGILFVFFILLLFLATGQSGWAVFFILLIVSPTVIALAYRIKELLEDRRDKEEQIENNRRRELEYYNELERLFGLAFSKRRMAFLKRNDGDYVFWNRKFVEELETKRKTLFATDVNFFETSLSRKDGYISQADYPLSWEYVGLGRPDSNLNRLYVCIKCGNEDKVAKQYAVYQAENKIQAYKYQCYESLCKECRDDLFIQEPFDFEDFENLTPREFEHLIGELFERMGYDVEVTREVGDYGLDVIAKNKQETIAIQVKKYSKNRVSNRDVQRLLGAMQLKNVKADKAILITTTDFTQQARTQAQGTPLQLWDRYTLKEMIDNHWSISASNVIESQASGVAVGEIVTCSKCNAKIKSTSFFCTACGEQVQKKCSNCENRILITAKFCTNCGQNNTML